jgi:hypothetical protein
MIDKRQIDLNNQHYSGLWRCLAKFSVWKGIRWPAKSTWLITIYKVHPWKTSLFMLLLGNGSWQIRTDSSDLLMILKRSDFTDFVRTLTSCSGSIRQHTLRSNYVSLCRIKSRALSHLLAMSQFREPKFTDCLVKSTW